MPADTNTGKPRNTGSLKFEEPPVGGGLSDFSMAASQVALGDVMVLIEDTVGNRWRVPHS